ncbi:MAG: hypothetical protein KIG96_02830 [Treponema sp.]|nr:hypothetical protein [Treponema sp.]
MVNITMVATRGHEIVKVFEYQVAEELREIAEEMEGVSFEMGGLYEGCIGEIVGVL